MGATIFGQDAQYEGLSSGAASTLLLAANNLSDVSNAATALANLGFAISNEADNRVLTATGTSNTINAEQYLTYNGTLLTATSVGGANYVSTVGPGLVSARWLISPPSSEHSGQFTVVYEADDVQYPVNVTREAESTNATDSFGVGVMFSIKDNTSSHEDIGEVKVLRNGADDTGKIVLSPYSSGSAVDVVEIEHNAVTIAQATSVNAALSTNSTVTLTGVDTGVGATPGFMTITNAGVVGNTSTEVDYNSGNDVTINGISLIVDGALSEFKGTSSTTAVVTVESDATLGVAVRAMHSTSQASALEYGLGLQHTTSADMVDGFGTGMVFQIKDGASSVESIAYITAERTASGDDSGRLRLSTVDGGTIEDGIVIDEDLITIGNDSADYKSTEIVSSIENTLSIKVSTSATNSIYYNTNVIHETSGTMANGFGSGINFKIDDGSAYTVGRMAFVRTNATDDTGEFYLTAYDAGTPKYIMSGNTYDGEVAIGHSTPVNDCALAIVSTTKALRIPQLTSGTYGALSGLTGMIAYDSTNDKIVVYTGSGWETVTSS